MTQINLFLELMDTINYLLVAGINSHNVYDARMEMNDIFSNFEEFDDVEAPQPITILDAIATKTLEMTPEAKQYFQLLHTFQTENEIFLQDLPLQSGQPTIEQVQLMIDFFTILNELLQVGVTPCNAHESHLKIDELFKTFEEEAEVQEDKLSAEDRTSSFLPDALQEALDAITMFPEQEHVTHATI